MILQLYLLEHVITLNHHQQYSFYVTHVIGVQFDKIITPVDNTCPRCGANNNELTSFPIISNEAFTFDYNDKCGVELEFKARTWPFEMFI